MMPENEQQLLEWNIENLWESFNTLGQENDINNNTIKQNHPKQYEQVKNGYFILIPIWYITKHWYEEYPSSGKVKILGYGKQSLIKFQEEIEKRKDTMRKIIQKYMGNDLTSPRA